MFKKKLPLIQGISSVWKQLVARPQAKEEKEHIA